MEARSYITFQDGHEEDIVYYNDSTPEYVLFATNSGMYIHNPNDPFQDGKFRRIELRGPSNGSHQIVTAAIPSIKSIVIDKRVRYSFSIATDGAYIFHGTCLAHPNATDDMVRLAIAKTLKIGYEKE